MRSDHYIHPEFGYLAPTSRLRRELRVGLFSMLFGIGVGVAALAALSVGSRDRQSGSVSPVETGGAVAAPSAATKVPPDGGHERLEAANVNIDRPRTEIEVQTGNAGKSDTSAGSTVNAERPAAKPPRMTVRAASDEPPIARLPLGRSDAFPGMVPPSEAQPEITPRGPLASGAPKLPPESTQSRTSQQGKSVADRLTSAPLPPKKPEKTVRDEAGRDARVGQAYARDSSSIPRGFWAWSW